MRSGIRLGVGFGGVIGGATRAVVVVGVAGVGGGSGTPFE